MVACDTSPHSLSGKPASNSYMYKILVDFAIGTMMGNEDIRLMLDVLEVKPPERPEWTRESECLGRRMLRLEHPGGRAKEIYRCSGRGHEVSGSGSERRRGCRGTGGVGAG